MFTPLSGNCMAVMFHTHPLIPLSVICYYDISSSNASLAVIAVVCLLSPLWFAGVRNYYTNMLLLTLKWGCAECHFLYLKLLLRDSSEPLNSCHHILGCHHSRWKEEENQVWIKLFIRSKSVFTFLIKYIFSDKYHLIKKWFLFYFYSHC